MATYYIDPSASGGGNGTQNSPYNSWSRAGTLKAGNTYLQKGGSTSNAMLIVSTQATAAQPIKIGVYGTGKATMRNALILQGCAHVNVSGFILTGHRYAGVTIQTGGAHHCEVKDCEIHACGAGVWIGDGAGGSHRIIENTIRNNKGNGIAVSVVNLRAGDETIFDSNIIKDNDTHGIELSGNHYIVTRNTISGNGRVTPGTSGIHCYAGGFQGTEFIDAGSYNLIEGNVCCDQRCNTTDGNGIQADQACHDNQILNNLSYNNDGGGIVLFDAWNNTMRDNITFGNARDPARSHPYKGELVLHADNNKTYSNVARDNQFCPTDPDRAPAINITSNVDRPNDCEVENNAVHLTVSAGTPPHFYTFPAGTEADGKRLTAWSPQSEGGATTPPPQPEPDDKEGGLVGTQ
jgi:parallel beta-helix repeat protein